MHLMCVRRFIVTKVAKNCHMPEVTTTTCLWVMGVRNSDMTSEFKPEVQIWSELRMRGEKSPK